MKKELLKGFTMLVLVAVLAFSTAVASGQSTNANKVIANIPFEFNVGYKTMPAGEYSVQTVATAGDALLIKNANANLAALRLSEATGRNKDKSHARLVFHRYGDRYFLAEVWNGVDDIGRQLLKSEDERAVEREFAIASADREAAHATYQRIEIAAVLR
ncbi:MAG TPA: hypothetical protein VGW76_04790 [Pyrinomonadaceae bacterium]|nr:hypothetical protein [Pyrinomonadaceae bacterium]